MTRLFILGLVLCLAGCDQKLSGEDAARINERMLVMAGLSQLPREVPTLIYTTDPDFAFAGEANCEKWSIKLNYQFTARNVDWVIDKVIPHEFGHIMSCFYRGGMGDDSHDVFWQEAVRKLGGDPRYK